MNQGEESGRWQRARPRVQKTCVNLIPLPKELDSGHPGEIKEAVVSIVPQQAPVHPGLDRQWVAQRDLGSNNVSLIPRGPRCSRG